MNAIEMPEVFRNFLMQRLTPSQMDAVETDADFGGISIFTAERINSMRNRPSSSYLFGRPIDETIEREIVGDMIGKIAQLLARQDIDLSSGTLSSWSGRIADRLSGGQGHRNHLYQIATGILWSLAREQDSSAKPIEGR